MSLDTRPLTWQEFAALPDDGNRHELVRGELIVSPPPGTNHGGYAGNITGHLFMHLKQKKIGGRVLSAETGVRLETDPDTVRACDVAYIGPARWPKGGVKDLYFQGAPDFVVEVLSKSDRMSDVDDKIDQWLATGAQLVWLVNPRRRSVTVYRPGQPPAMLVEPQTLDAGEVVPGFTLPVAEIFALD